MKTVLRKSHRSFLPLKNTNHRNFQGLTKYVNFDCTVDVLLAMTLKNFREVSRGGSTSCTVTASIHRVPRRVIASCIQRLLFSQHNVTDFFCLHSYCPHATPRDVWRGRISAFTAECRVCTQSGRRLRRITCIWHRIL